MEEIKVNELELRSKLNKKKNAVRKSLAERGILKRGGHNSFDNYSYFSEAQYKELFTKMLSEYGLELSFNEVEYSFFEGSGKQANGRLVKIEFELTDIDTGYSVKSIISAEGMDKGDKAGYKAYTGALKYFFANTFMVATGDDAETESIENKATSKTGSKPQNIQNSGKASEKQVALMRKICSEHGFDFNEEKAKEMSKGAASEFISKYVGGGNENA